MATGGITSHISKFTKNINIGGVVIMIIKLSVIITGTRGVIRIQIK